MIDLPKSCVLIVLGGLLLTGCGATHGMTVTVTTPAAQEPTTQPATTTTPAAAASTAAPDPSKPPDFVLTGQSSEGDKVRVEGRFGPALPPSQSDVDQTALSQCHGADGRELIVRLDLTTTIQSSLAADVNIEGFHATDPLATGATEFLMGYSDGPSCEGSSIDFRQLEPHVPEHLTLWAILEKAITPKDLHPSARALEGWHMSIPAIYLNHESPANQHLSVRGPRVIQCRRGDWEPSTFISIAGTVPHIIPYGNVWEIGEHYSCKAGV